MQVGTFTVTGSPFIIENADGVYNISILAQGGVIGVTGSLVLNGLPSNEIDVPDGQSLTYSSTPTNPIDYLKIDPKAFTAILAVSNS